MTTLAFDPIDTSLVDPRRGARNLLAEAIDLKAGEKLLVVVEPAGTDHYRGDVGAIVAEVASELGAQVELATAGTTSGSETFPPTLAERIGRADHTVFFSRLGDQVRFARLPGSGTKTMTYTLDPHLLGDLFGRLPFKALEAVRAAVTARIAGARHYAIRCPRGTDLVVEREAPATDGPGLVTPFTVINFPAMIVPPIAAAGANGRLVLAHALTSTSIHSYDDDILPLDRPVTLLIRDGRVVDFEGDAETVARVVAHFERVGSIVGGDPWALNSWHTGINPTTVFAAASRDEIHRWGSVAFGSPRYTHFHLCGNAPGDICGQVFDATIAFDGEVLWQDGRFVYLERPEIAETLRGHGVDPALAGLRRDIGLPAALA